MHVFNRAIHEVDTDALAFFPSSAVEATAATPSISSRARQGRDAWRLGKRYAQDEPLDWGCSADRPAENPPVSRRSGHTLRNRVRETGT